MLAVSALSIAACNEDEIELYKGPAYTHINTLVLGGWEMDTWVTDSVASYDFLKDPAKDHDIVRLRFGISGVKSASDRVLELEYSGDFNAEHQSAFPSSVTVPAGSVTVDVQFEVYRPLKEDEGRDNSARIKVRETGGFVTGPEKSVRIEFGLTPSIWPAAWGWSADFFLGKCSKTKFRIIYELFGTYDLDIKLAFGMFDTDTQKKYVTPLKEFVERYNDESVTMERNFGPIPLKDENGKEIVIGN